MSSMATVNPPVATKIRHEMVMFGDVRDDDYYWLRDDSRSDPRVLDYLRQENAYTDYIMNGNQTLQDQIFMELKGRIKEDDISAPLRDGPYFYYTRTLEGKEYVQHCRRRISDGEGPGSVYEVMPTSPDAPAEHVILDENVKAQGHEYCKVEAFKVSPNHKLVAYAEDTKGDEIYNVYIIDADTLSLVEKPIIGVTDYIEWAGNESLLYITNDEIHRPYKTLQDQIFMELKGRIKEDDISAPLRDGPYFYYTRTLEGKEYVQHCRRRISDGEGPGSVYEVMPTSPDAPAEHVILDENVKAQGHEYCKVEAFKVSPNHKLVAYAEDTKGDEIYNVYIIDADTLSLVEKPIIGVTDYIEWAGNESLLYITNDEIHRPYKVVRAFQSNQSDEGYGIRSCSDWSSQTMQIRLYVVPANTGNISGLTVETLSISDVF